MSSETDADHSRRRGAEERDAENGEDETPRGNDAHYEHKEEVGATAGRSHADVLKQTLPPDLARKSALRRDRSDMEP